MAVAEHELLRRNVFKETISLSPDTEAQLSRDFQPAFPPLEYERLPDGSIRMPLAIYARLFRSYTPPAIGSLVSGLTQAVTQGKQSIAFGSGPHHALSRVALEEEHHGLFKHDTPSENIPTIMSIWGHRLTQGEYLPNTRSEVDTVMGMLKRGGADYDCKTPEMNILTGYDSALNYLRGYYGRIEQTQKGDEHIAYLTNPNIPEIHELERYLLGKFTSLSIRNSQEQIPLGILRAGPIPVARHLQIVSLDITSINPDGSINPPTYSVHHTSSSNGIDYRSDPRNSSYQTDVFGYIDPIEGFITFPASAIAAHRDYLTFPASICEDTSIATQAIMRAMRIYMHRNLYTLPETAIRQYLSPDFDQNIRPGRAEWTKTKTLTDLLAPETIDVMCQAMKMIKNRPNEIPEQLRTEMIAELAASALSRPIDPAQFVNISESWTILKGMKDLNQSDIEKWIRSIHRRICEYFCDNHDNTSFENSDLGYQHSLEEVDFPYLYNIGTEINLLKMPDGMSLWVEAIEEIRSDKGLSIFGNNYSIASRFCEYFGI